MGLAKLWFAVLSASGGSAFIYGSNAAFLNILYFVIFDWYKDIIHHRDYENMIDLFIMGPFIAASFPLGGIVGSLFICVSATFCGRKLGLLCSTGIAIISLFFLAISYLLESVEIFIIGRFIIGISAGLSSGLTPIYLIEIAPPCMRGTIGSFYFFMIAASITISHIFALPEVLGTYSRWAYFFAGSYIPVFLQLLMLVFCPETPRHLLFDKENEYECEEAVIWFSRSDGDTEIDDLHEEGRVLKEVGPMGIERYFDDQTIRSPLIIATVIMVGRQICGYDGILYFSTAFFKDMGYSVRTSVELTIGLGAVSLIAAIICMILVDRIGRKPLLMGSFGGMIFSIACFSLIKLLSTAARGTPEEVKHVSTFFIFLYAFTFAFGAGTIPWFYAAEICNHLARAKTVTTAVTFGWLVHFSVVMSFLPLKFVVGEYILMIYFIFDIITLIFIVLTMRETMDLSAIDIIELFYD